MNILLDGDTRDDFNPRRLKIGLVDRAIRTGSLLYVSNKKREVVFGVNE